MKFTIILLVFNLTKIFCTATPILIWLGLFADPKDYVDYVRVWIGNHTESDIYIKIVDVHVNGVEGALSTVFVHPMTQIDIVCEEIRNDVRLANGFHAIGFSQGGQFL